MVIFYIAFAPGFNFVGREHIGGVDCIIGFDLRVL